MRFQLQSVYFIYTWLIVHTTLNLAYLKEHVYYMLLICGMTSLFQNILYLSMTHNHMTMTYDCIICNVILTLNPKSKK